MNAIADSAGTTGLSSAARADHRVRERLLEASQRFSSLDRDVQRFVRRKPVTATLAALAVGFILGRLVSRL